MPANLTLAPSTTFVGRSSELHALVSRLQSALEGIPSVVLLTGDAGIGKTRLAHEVTAEAQLLGVVASFGRFIEDGALPFAAFDSLIAALVHSGASESGALGGGSELLRRMSEPTADSVTEAAPGHVALIGQALARGVTFLAAQQPRLVILDDLQWARPEALDVFASIAIALADAASAGEPCRVVLVGIHRPVERDDPLARRLERLRRESAVAVIHVGGLDELETNALIANMSSSACAPAFLNAITAATRGNPLFIVEAVDALAAEGALRLEGGRITSDVAPSELPLPAEVTRAVRTRVDALEPSLRRLLGTAALVGDGFSLDVLRIAADEDENALSARIDAAIEARLLAESGEDYRFAHPLIRAAAVETLTRARRRREHAAIAGRLIGAFGDDPKYTLEIAHHLVSAGSSAPQEAVAHYTRRAGEAAFAGGVWSDSARYYEAALAAENDAGISTRARLAERAAQAHARNMDFPRAIARFSEASDGFREAGDVESWAGALEGWFSLRTAAFGASLSDDGSEPYERFMAAAGEGHVRARGLVMCRRAEALYAMGRGDCIAVAEEALSLGRECGDALLQLHALMALANAQLFALDADAAYSCHMEALRIAGGVEEDWYRADPHINLSLLHFVRGEFDAAEHAAVEACGIFRELGNYGCESLEYAGLAAVAMARGSFDKTERMAVEADRLVSRSGYAWTATTLFPALVQSRILRGRWAEAADGVGRFAAAGFGPGARPLQRTIDAWAAGTSPQARRSGTAGSAVPTMFSLGAAIARFEANEFQAESTPGDHAILDAAIAGGILFAPGTGVSLQRLRGVAALGREDGPAAITHFNAAAATAKASGALVEYGRSQLWLARAHRAGRDGPKGVAAASEARRVFAELGMTPFLDAAEGLLDVQPEPAAEGVLSDLLLDVAVELARGGTAGEIADRLLVSEDTVHGHLGALARSGVTDLESARAFLDAHEMGPLVAYTGKPRALQPVGLRILMFTDIVDSTPTNRRLGDLAYAELIGEQAEIIGRHVRTHGGTVVKGTGDGVFASFPSASGALAAALQIQDSVPTAHRSMPELPVRMRVGLHAGEPIAAGDDLFGVAVTMSARVCARCPGGSVLVTELVRELARSTDVSYVDFGRTLLKGFDDRVRLYEVRRAGS